VERELRFREKREIDMIEKEMNIANKIQMMTEELSKQIMINW